ncbi:MAG TPA: hypothetical protein VGI07_13870 [Solirubrobacteraceae bacterium]
MPPSVGLISVSIGATIIGGKVISPGVNVSTPGVALPPITSTPSTPGVAPPPITSTPLSGTTFPINGTPVH